MVDFAETDVGRIAADPLLVLVSNLDAAVVGYPRPEEGSFLAE